MRRVALGLLLALALFAVLEGGARLWRSRLPARPSTGLEWMEHSARLGWRNRPGFRGTAFDTERTFDENGLFTVDAAAAAPEGRGGRRLVLLLGDSRTFGNGVPVEATYGEILKQRLPNFAVINRAVPGYSSFQGRAALEVDSPRFRPDVVVFAFGFNDRRYVLHPEEVDGEERFRRLARQATWTRLAGSLALVDVLGGRPSGEPGAVEDPLDLGSVLPRVSPASFRRNLEAAARYCAGQKIRLVLLLLNDNPAHVRELDLGLGDLRKGRLAEAEQNLRSSVALGNAFSDAARLELAALYSRTGRPREAATVRISPRTFYSVTGGYPVLSQQDYRSISFAVAARDGIQVVDTGPVLDWHPEWYLDFCHFGGEGHRAVADLLAAEILQAQRR